MNSYTETPTANPLQIMLKYALAWVLIDVVLLLLFYYIFPSIVGTMKESIVKIIISLGLAIYFTLQIRKEIGGYWTFGEAFKTVFLLFFIPAIILYGFRIVFAKIDPQYENLITETTLNSSTAMMENFITDQDQLDKAIEEMEKGVYVQFHPGFVDVLKFLAQVVVIYLIAAAIWALIFKKEKPIFIEEEDSTAY
ncbi:DUF4199 domain-containing protein [Olivibacter sitiensis]|uniref:DUF4199 domain-containing protein n=1 Tax=Olivibacter sitiensis TaxID=376470 RepID=UPI00048650E4|nr:DUF4199 domain-containing protein [Olivibacter sitiensis]